MTFYERLERLDLSLLKVIGSEMTDVDRASLLALHLACRRAHGSFRWLEIGSHLGGSLQALVRDPACERIDSIDPRPPAQDDERGERYAYPENSTQRMLDLLGALEDAELAKLHTHEADTAALDPSAFPQPHVCFVDGEHTDRVAERDAAFCRAALRDEGLIVFHDVGVIYRAVRRFVDAVCAEGLTVGLAYLPDSLFAVELGTPRLLGDEAVLRRRLEAHWGALWLLDSNDRFRRALDRPVLRVLRRRGWLRVDDG